MRFSETVTCLGKTSGREWPDIATKLRLLRDFDSGLMAKDKSEKKKKQVSEDVPPAVKEDVEMAEMKVSSNHCRSEDAQ
jgi:hypothetical protein